jgi:hypothetical protein
MRHFIDGFPGEILLGGRGVADYCRRYCFNKHSYLAIFLRDLRYPLLRITSCV